MRERGKYTEFGQRLIEMFGTQDELAKALELDRTVVSRKLRGEIPIMLRDLEKAAKYLRMPIGALFTLRGTDGGVLKAFYEMHMYDPIALDKIIDAFHYNRRSLRVLAAGATEFMECNAPEPSRLATRLRDVGTEEGSDE